MIISSTTALPAFRALRSETDKGVKVKNTVIIKANKYGLQVNLDPDIPFPELLADVRDKFKETAKFWGDAKMVLTLDGRKLSGSEELKIVNSITENSDIEVVCLVDPDGRRIDDCEQALTEKLMELAARTGEFFKGTIRSGESIDSEASIVIIGDVNKGAKVSAGGSVIVLGSLKGEAWAGCGGNDNCAVVAFDMEPSKVKIGDLFLEKFPRKKGPKVISIKSGRIVCEQVQKSFLTALDFI